MMPAREIQSMTLSLLISTGPIVAFVLFVFCIGCVLLLLRNKVRCPTDGSSMKLTGGKGTHLVFRCPKCGHEQKTHIRKGRR
jgi:predicted RNA-binding Zn-ribbon protein involved in translation (DUF1610 family)